MVPTSRLGSPAWSHRESVFEVPGGSLVLFLSARAEGSRLCPGHGAAPHGMRLGRPGGSISGSIRPPCAPPVPARLGTMLSLSRATVAPAR